MALTPKAATGPRFIDLADHGGCSKKCDVDRLKNLLAPPGREPSSGIGPDAGLTQVAGVELAGTVDVVLPMVDDPGLFGRIVCAHVLNDLFAVGAMPRFALNVLGLPGLDAPSGALAAGDGPIREMLDAAARALAEEGAVGIGGHTLWSDFLFYGMAATGEVPPGQAIGIDSARAGDCLLVTKPVGTSVATRAWKLENRPIADFQDALDGMLASSRGAAAAMRAVGRCGATDVSGFGFLGHLHNLVASSGLGAEVRLASVPVYESCRQEGAKDGTRILEANAEFSAGVVAGFDELAAEERVLLCDAQISGGLLVAIDPERREAFLDEVARLGSRAWEIGSVTETELGRIELT